MHDAPLLLRRAARPWLGLLMLGLPLAAAADTYVLAVGSQAVQQTNSGVGWSESARAEAAADFGVGKIKLNVAAFSDPTDGYPVGYRVARAEAVTGYTDTVTFSSSSIAPGTIATVAFGIRFDYGGLAAFSGGGPGVINQEGAALWSLRQSFGGNQFDIGCSWNTSAFQSPADWSCSGFDPSGQPADRIQGRSSFVASVVFGQPLPLTFYLTALAGMTVYAQQVGYYAAGDLTLAMGNSFYWDGVDTVTVDGVAVDFTLSSESGTNYTTSLAPIPEPGTALLWAGGLGLLLAARRARR